jgi:8-oxo-dGTP pyrophosphatase MutT (NUDIX family)
VDVFLLLTSGDQLLLALRQGTGYADGQWNLPSGKLEVGEDVVTAMRREAWEEIGIRLPVEDLSHAVTVHHRNRREQGRVALVFAAEWNPLRHGEPVNAEPHKCAGIDWYAVDQLPPRPIATRSPASPPGAPASGSRCPAGRQPPESPTT